MPSNNPHHARWMHRDWCSAAHLHSQSTTDKPSQGVSLAPDISLLSPELQQQWHVDKNMHLGPTKVKPQSHTKAVWQCNACLVGQPHVWLASMANRSRGTQCPYCRNRLVCAHNSLAAVAPDLAKYWNHSKNQAAPEQVLAGSNSRAHWKCPSCKWEWQAPISMRTTCLVAPSAFEHRKSASGSPLLLQLSLRVWLNGTISATKKRAFIQKTSLSAAAGRCTGSAHAVQEGSHTAGQQHHVTA